MYIYYLESELKERYEKIGRPMAMLPKKSLLKTILHRFRAAWQTGMTRSPYVLSGTVAFAGSAVLSFYFFREPELDITVHLASVQFRDEIPQSFAADSVMKPAQVWDATTKSGGKIDRILVHPGEVVKKNQLLAVINETESRAALQNALTAFKSDHSAQNRASLEAAQRKAEESLVRSPGDGFASVEGTATGPIVQPGATIVRIEDRSKLALFVQIPETISRRLGNQIKITLTASGNQPIDALAGVQFASAKPGPSGTDVGLDLILPPEAPFMGLLQKPVHISIGLEPIRHVALVDKRAVVTNGGDAKILVLSSYGTMHWHRVNSQSLFDDRLVVKGIDAKTFKVVLPENIDLLNKAVTLNATPKVKG